MAYSSLKFGNIWKGEFMNVNTLYAEVKVTCKREKNDNTLSQYIWNIDIAQNAKI